MKDWIGNKNSIYKTLGASNHVEEERAEHDYYATEPKAVELLLEVEKFSLKIWEYACGGGHMTQVLIDNGYEVLSSDIVDRGYHNTSIIDFLKEPLFKLEWDGDIITNPPYKYAQEFIEKSLEVVNRGRKVAMFLKIQFLEGKKRKKLFEKYPPKVIYVSSSRLLCAKNGNFESMKQSGGSAVAYAWFIWEKGFNGNPIIKWI